MADSGGRRFGTPALVVVGALAFVLGAVLGWGALGDVGETPCWEVEARTQPIRDQLTDSFGTGEAGQAAVRSMARTAEEHPDCFSPEEREFYADLRDTAGAGSPGATDAPVVTDTPDPGASPTT